MTAKHLKKLLASRQHALKDYERASAKYFKALKANEEELKKAIELAAENISYLKPCDFADITLCWDHTLADALEELREEKKVRELTEFEKPKDK